MRGPRGCPKTHGLLSLPVNPVAPGKLSQPSIWSYARFSIIRTTKCLMGPKGVVRGEEEAVAALFSALVTPARSNRPSTVTNPRYRGRSPMLVADRGYEDWFGLHKRRCNGGERSKLPKGASNRCASGNSRLHMLQDDSGRFLRLFPMFKWPMWGEGSRRTEKQA